MCAGTFSFTYNINAPGVSAIAYACKRALKLFYQVKVTIQLSLLGCFVLPVTVHSQMTVHLYSWYFQNQI